MDILGTNKSDTLVGTANADILDGGKGADTLIGGAGDDTLLGGAGADSLDGGSGNDLLDGGSGADQMAGGTGNDTYIVDDGRRDIVIEQADGGIDTVLSSDTYTLTAQVENLVLTDNRSIDGTGNELDNSITGNDGNNLLDGGAGADTLTGGRGNDTYIVDNAGDVVIEATAGGTDTVVSSISYNLGANLENLELTGAADLAGTGNALDNTLTGNDGANVLDGGAGADLMVGGLGNDTYIVDNAGDVVREQGTGGIDTVRASVSYTLGSNVENLTLTGTAAIDGTGNALNNVLVGNSAANRMVGDLGNDTLDGGAGADTLVGGAGDDTYVVDNAGDQVLENAGEGIDTVTSSVGYALGANVENLTLVGSAASGTGNDLDNTITGNAADNLLDGGLGNDTLIGGAGNDTYVIDAAGDQVVEAADEGTDTVVSGIDYVLGANLENLTLTGTAVSGTGNTLDNILVGNAGDNVLTGGAGNDSLDGGSGADTLMGGIGNDTYVVDSSGDQVIEAAGEGTDTVVSGIDYVLGSEVENLALTGTAVSGTGNDADNTITGNAADNFLDGGLGSDTLIGGAGNDTYLVDSASDQVVEAADEGTDTVVSGIDYALGANLENLTLAATALAGTGNELDNVLTGNSADNALDGAAGADTLVGGTGNDTLLGGAGDDVYLFGRGDGQDTITDSNGNRDTIRFAAGIGAGDVTLSRDASNLYLAVNGTEDKITVTGWYDSPANRVERVEFADGTTWDESVFAALALPNALPMNDEIIFGTAGADTLDGEGGFDILYGLGGDDVYVFGRGYGEDSISDYDATAGNMDTVRFNPDVTAGQVVLSRDERNLYLTIAGTKDKLTIGGWFDSTAYRVERVEFSDGTVWDEQTLAAAAFPAPEPILGTPTGDVLQGRNDSNDLLRGLGGNDRLYGGAGDDVLDGGAGDDLLAGGAGNDTYLIGRNDGMDRIVDVGAGDTADRIRFAADIAVADVTIGRIGDDLILQITAGGSVTVASWFADPALRVESVEFADGTVWDATLLSAAPGIPLHDVTGTIGNDFLYGTTQADRIDGQAGDDVLAGAGGDDVYLFGHGSGKDRIYDHDATLGNMDTIRLAADVQAGDILLQRDGSDLTLTLDSGDSLRVVGWFADAANRVERVEFADGTVWDESYLEGATPVPAPSGPVPTITGTARNDYLYGTDGADYIAALGESDQVYGNGGDDLIDGGSGNDWLGGGDGNDTLLGQSGNDQLHGDSGDDVLDGGDGDDYLEDGNGNNVLSGGDGNDDLFAGSGDDTLVGGQGSDYVLGGDGNDVLDGGQGNDTLYGGYGNDVYLFGRGYGNDVITEYDTYNPDKVDVIRLAADIRPQDVQLTQKSGYGGSFLLSIIGTSDTLAFNDIERIEFADGTTWNAATILAAPLVGTAGDDYVWGSSGNDVLEGLGGNDDLAGGYGNDVYVFGRGDGRDTISEEGGSNSGTDTLRLRDGILPTDVTLWRSQYDLYVGINGTNDQVKMVDWFWSGYPHQVERIEFANGTVWNTATLAAAQLRASPAVMGTDAGDQISAGADNDVVLGLAGDDVLQGDGGNDSIEGGAGNDQLFGGYGNDTLDGGAGNDMLDGGDGDDTYRFGPGSGQDVISDLGWSGNTDRVVMAAGVRPQDVALRRDGYNLCLALPGTDDVLTMQNWFLGSEYRIERIEFSDGTAWDTTAIVANTADAMVDIVGSSADETLHGTDFSEQILAGAGDDVVNGGSGNDTIIGGAGNDTLYADTDSGPSQNYGGGNSDDILDGGYNDDLLAGGGGNDTYIFGRGYGRDTIYEWDWTQGNTDTIRLRDDVRPGDVTLSRGWSWYGDHGSLVLTINDTGDTLTVDKFFDYDGAKIEQVKFADGTVWDASVLNAVPILGSNTRYPDYMESVYGSFADDILDGQAGNDYLYGSYGNDVYLFGRGDDQDTISDYDWHAGNTDVLRFKAGVAPGDVTLFRDTGSLYLQINGTTDQVRIQNWFTDPTYRVEKVEFSDGTVWDTASLAAAPFLPYSMTGTNGGDQISGTDGDDTLYGVGGNDRIGAGQGNDLVDGGDGNDSLYGEDGNDTLMGGAGDDYITGNAGQDQIDGGSGNDYLDGGQGSDVYLFGIGSGQDTISEYDWQAGNTDVLRIKPGVAPADVVLSRSPWGGDLVVSIKGTQDTVTLRNWFYGESYQIETIEFADGTVWGTDVLAAAPLIGSDGTDTLNGSYRSDTLEGQGGDDQIYGLEGDDRLEGGTGNDRLVGGSGDDVYVFGRGDGQDIISETDTGLDTIRLRDGVAPQDVTLWQDGSNLYLAINGTEDRLTVGGWFKDAAYQVEKIEFADGTVWDTTTLAAAEAGPAVVNTTGYGTAGDDLLTGRGDMTGGMGDDTYFIDRFRGVQRIRESGGYPEYLSPGGDDVIRFSDDILPSDVKMSRQGSDLVLSVSMPTNYLAIWWPNEDKKITVEGWFDNPDNRVERVEFADGSVWDTAVLENAAPALSSDNWQDTYGTPGDDDLHSGSGDNYLYGGAGNDTYHFGRNSGNDTINETSSWSGAGNDTIRLDDDVLPTDVVLSRDGDDLKLTIRDSQNSLLVRSWFSEESARVENVAFADGTVWDASLLQLASVVAPVGTPGVDDNLVGTDGNDILDGRGGREWAGYNTSPGDNLSGGYGDDTYVFARGYGALSIYDNGDGQDTLRLDGLRPEDVTLERVYPTDLVLRVKGSNDAVTMHGWYEFGSNADYYRIEKVQFADGTVWGKDELLAVPITGSDQGQYVYGTGQDDIIDAGTGFHQAQAGSGNDTYVFKRGYGYLKIYDDGYSYPDTSTRDTIRLELMPEDVTLTQDGRSLYISVKGSNDVVQVSDWFSNYYHSFRVERVEFVDGTVWDVNVLNAAAFDKAPPIYLGSDNSFFQGTNGDDSIHGEEGDDFVRTNGGNDLLDGGAGIDHMEGGAGDDIYVFGRGYGSDTVQEESGNDTVKFNADVAVSDVSLNRSGNDLCLAINGTDDVLTITNWFADPAGRVEQVQFADGTVWGTSVLEAAPYPAPAANLFIGTEQADTLTGTPDGDTLQGNGGNDSLDAGAGDDLLEGGDGDDVLSGGDGRDWLYGNAGDDILDGGAGDDVLEGGAGNDVYLFGRGAGRDEIAMGADDVIRMAADIRPSDVTYCLGDENQGVGLVINDTNDRISFGWYSTGTQGRVEFADGTVWDLSQMAPAGYVGTMGQDRLEGTSGADLLNGRSGIDYLFGDEGNDVYLFGRGSDQDVVYDYDATWGNQDTIRLAADLTPDDIALSQDGHSLYLRIKDSGDVLRVIGWFEDRALRVERVEFADGTVWDTGVLAAAPLADALPFTADGAHTYAYGTEGDDVFDFVNSDGAEPVGGNGNDVYLFGRGSGRIEIQEDEERNPKPGYIDVIRMKNGVAPSDVRLSQDGRDLYVDIIGTSDHIEVDDMFEYADGRAAIERIEFADGTVWDESVLQAAPSTHPLPGTAGDDTLVGNVDDNTLDGYAGNDTLDGGAGNDVMNGGDGDDTYVFGRGYGQDTIADYSATANADRVSLNADVQPEDLVLSRDASNLYLGIKGTSDRLTMKYWYDAPSYRVEQLAFADGTVWDLASLGTSLPFLGSTGIDSLQGTAGNDVMQGLAGADVLKGEGGNDLLLGAGDRDILKDGSGNSFLAGGEGHDSLLTGGGADIIAFNRGDGQDDVYGATDGATLSLGGGIAYGDLALSKDGDSLVLTTGTGDSITLRDWYQSANGHSGVNLQVIAEAMAGFDAASADPLLNSKVQQFDFAGLVDRFDSELAANPGLTSWSLSNALLDFHLAGSDTAAIGGDLAYQYGKNGSLSGIAVSAAQGVLSDPQFGTGAQTLQPLATLQDGQVKIG